MSITPKALFRVLVAVVLGLLFGLLDSFTSIRLASRFPWPPMPKYNDTSCMDAETCSETDLMLFALTFLAPTLLNVFYCIRIRKELGLNTRTAVAFICLWLCAFIYFAGLFALQIVG